MKAKTIIMSVMCLLVVLQPVTAYGGIGGGFILPPLIKKILHRIYSCNEHSLFVFSPSQQEYNGERVVKGILVRFPVCESYEVSLPSGKEYHAYYAERLGKYNPLTSFEFVKAESGKDIYNVTFYSKTRYILITEAKK